MQVQLLLEDNVMELDSTVSFPMNKVFSNLSKPTDIFVDYTKNIAVPATAHNNKILGNAYRLDKQFGTTDSALGLSMNPLKRIPAKLLYNNELIFDGYAKYTSSTQKDGNIYYNLNLYGAIGDVFQSLVDVVLDYNKLSDEQKAEEDGGAKYILDDLMYETPVIDMSTVNTCWEYDGEPLVDSNYYSVIGFAPAYRGLYDNFESNSIVALETVSVSDGTPKSVEDVLKEEWKVNIKQRNPNMTDEQVQARVDAIDFKSVIGNGINEHSIRQFRSYEQKPYVYFCKLMKMYQNKCKELTGYDLKLDQSWFNANNPYWTRLCYMFDYLSGRGVNEDQTTAFSGYTAGPYTDSTSTQFSRSVIYTNFSDEVLNSNKISLKAFTIDLQNMKDASSDDPMWSGNGNLNDSVVMLNDKSYATVDIEFINTYGTIKTFKYYAANNVTNVSAPSGYDKFIQISNVTEIDKENRKLAGHSYITIPAIMVPSVDTHGLKMVVTVRINGEAGKILVYRHRVPIKGATRYNYHNPVVNDDDNQVIIPNTEFYSNWRLNTSVSLKNLYNKDEPLFNVILQYTKMFGLLWKPDYANKSVTITTRHAYFKDYEVIDWTDKFDGSKDCIIEPVTFDTKYINFDYKDVDGFRYTGYKNKYGINYGGKRVKTKYEFNNKSTDMIENMHPSSVSTKSFIPLNELIVWDTYTKLEPVPSPINFIDSENAEQSGSISLNNWYFRGKNYYAYDDDYFLSDASEQEKSEGKYYWMYNSYGLFEDPKCTMKVDYLPTFSPVYDNSDRFTQNRRYIGCLMNCPNEDFTADKSVSTANGQYIYDLCWRDYINERYNSNNKKVTAYFNITYNDFNQFNFNKLVKFDNQLFMVNKIYDFDPNTKESTKVDLIQISDINGYTDATKLFPPISTNVSVISGTGDYGTKTVYFKVYPRPNSHEIIKESGTGNVFVEDVEILGIEASYTITYENAGTWRGTFKLVGDGYEYEIPIEIN